MSTCLVGYRIYDTSTGGLSVTEPKVLTYLQGILFGSRSLVATILTNSECRVGTYRGI